MAEGTLHVDVRYCLHQECDPQAEEITVKRISQIEWIWPSSATEGKSLWEKGREDLAGLQGILLSF